MGSSFLSFSLHNSPYTQTSLRAVRYLKTTGDKSAPGHAGLEDFRAEKRTAHLSAHP